MHKMTERKSGVPRMALALIVLVLGSCAPAGHPEIAVPPSAAGLPRHGYLDSAAMPDSLDLLPPPPAPGSAALARDEAASASALALAGTPRFALAARDADLTSPKATAAFSCAAGFGIGPDSTPRLDALLRRVGADFGGATGKAKTHYARPRPFMVNAKPSCTPQDEAYLRNNGSYPSGHSALGMGWALVLAELVPDRTTQLVSRGRAFGESRRYCNVHWLSDVEEGRFVAAAVFARLQADAAFRADLEAARTEIAGLRADGPGQDCAAEASALAGGQ